MTMVRKALIFLLFLCVAPFSLYAAQQAGGIEIEDGASDALLRTLTASAAVSEPQLSLSGGYIAFYRLQGGRRVLTLGNLATGAEDSTDLLALDIRWFLWAGSPADRLVLVMSNGHIVSLNPADPKAKPAVLATGDKPQLVTRGVDDSSDLLVQWRREGDAFPSLYRLSPDLNRLDIYMSAWRPVVRWWAAPGGAAIWGEAYTDGGHILLRPDINGDWAPVVRAQQAGPRDFSVQAVLPSQQILVAAPQTGDKACLWTVGETGFAVEPLYCDGSWDVAGVRTDPVTGDLMAAIAARVEGVDIPLSVQEDAALKAVEHDRPRARATLQDRSLDGGVRLYRLQFLRRADCYVLWRADKPLAYLHDECRGSGPPTDYTHIQIMRGDDVIPAILATPGDTRIKGGLVYAHGGPARRVVARYRPLFAWLTAHGYAVLAPNFRGSTGYGQAWLRAGYGAWGDEILADLAAAADWLVAAGHARQGNVGIFGASFGGYAAMAASAVYGEHFAAAAALSGISDLLGHVKRLEASGLSTYASNRIRADFTDVDLLRRSPLARVDRIYRPLLLVHGGADGTVPVDHSIEMAKALEKRGRPVQFIRVEEAGHSLNTPQQKQVYYRNLLKFFDAHLGAQP